MDACLLGWWLLEVRSFLPAWLCGPLLGVRRVVEYCPPFLIASPVASLQSNIKKIIATALRKFRLRDRSRGHARSSSRTATNIAKVMWSALLLLLIALVLPASVRPKPHPTPRGLILNFCVRTQALVMSPGGINVLVTSTQRAAVGSATMAFSLARTAVTHAAGCACTGCMAAPRAHDSPAWHESSRPAHDHAASFQCLECD